MSLDLESHLVFYGSYHNNSTNVFIHTICVPLILITSLCMISYSGTLVNTPSWITPPYLDLNLGTLAAFAYAALYILLEPVAGTTLGVIVMAATAVANFSREQDPQLTFQVSLGAWLTGWILQFIGHGAFEGRAPALVDNLFQALFLAPIFVWLELLFKLGYRAELRERVDRRAKLEIAKFRKSADKNGKAH